jgi:hypothetical protein
MGKIIMEEEKTTEIQRSVNPVEVLNKIQEQLSGFSREPFRKELSRFLCFSPSDEAVQAHANKSPDRWSQAVTILARLSGINDKVDDTSQSEYSPHKFQNMSMMEKQKTLAELESKIKDELKKELERRGAIVDPDTLEEVSILELHNGETKRPGYPFEACNDKWS